jgi:alkylated DNA repair dioxygenase AlkB
MSSAASGPLHKEKGAPKNKRKMLISDFFTSKRQCPAESGSPRLSLELPHPIVPKVPGLTILRDFVSKDEEQQLLQFLYDPVKCPWRTDLSRRCMHFGGTYCFYTRMNQKHESSNSKPEVLQAPPMPSDLSWLLDRFISKGVFAADQIPQYCIVNEYVDAQGISAHVENFLFAEPVVGLSLLSSVHMRFHELVREDGGSVRSGKAAKAEKTGRVEDVLLEGRSLCIMREDSRWKWQHEIPRSKRGRGSGWKRVSLTFRWKKKG